MLLPGRIIAHREIFPAYLRYLPDVEGVLLACIKLQKITLSQHLNPIHICLKMERFGGIYYQISMVYLTCLLLQVTPLIHKSEYARRRSNLIEQILKQSDSSKANIVVVPSASKVYMSGKIPYVFRQDSDFFYLTGCLEPDVALVLISSPGSNEGKSMLFIPQIDSQVSYSFSVVILHRF